MGKQINFYMTDSDLAGFFDSLKQIGFWSVPPVLPKDAVPDRVSLANLDPRRVRKLYLIPLELAPVEAMYRTNRSEPSKDVLDLPRSPVLEFLIPRQEETELHEGRIFMQTDTSHPLYKHAEAAFRKIARLVDKWPKTDKYDFRVGSEAARTVRDGKASLKHFKTRLKLAES